MKLICGDICDVVIFERDALIAENEARSDVLRGGFAAGALAKPGAEPKWNLIFPRGTWHGPNFARVGGSFTVDDGFMSEVVSNWEASGKPRIPVRWGHEHMKAPSPDQVRALDRKAGNVVDLRITAAGLEGLTDWNKEGAADVESGTFDGWSAEWWPKHVNRLTGETRGWYLSGVALTNNPYFELLPPIAASLVEPTINPQHRSNTMNEEQLKALRARLGLAADATVEQCLTAAGKAAAALTASAEPNTEAITAAVAPVKAQVDVLTAAVAKKDEQLASLTASLLERDVKALVATAKRGDGKTGRGITEVHEKRALKIAKDEGMAAAEEFLGSVGLPVPLTATGVQGSSEGPLTKEAAQKKLNERAEQLRKEKVPDAMFAAMKEMPDVALIASTSTTAA